MNRWLLRRQQTTLSSSSSFTTAASSSSSSHDALFDRMTQLLQHNCRLVVAVAGGGTHFASTLAATPGASQVLLEAVTLYDREAFCAFVGSTTTTTHINKFASMPAAQKAATAALQRALQWTVGPTTCARSNYSSLQQMPCTVGLACASQLNSNHTTTSTTSNSSSSQAFVVAQLPQGSVVQMRCTIPSCLHRREQDVQVAHAMLTCLEYALQLREDAYNNNNNNSQDSYATLWKQRLENVSVTTIYASLLEWTETITDTGEQRHVQITVPGCPVIDAARAILQQQQQQEKVMLLIPQQQQQQFKVIQGSVATLPPHSLIVPGSFNPPHIGHVQLALAALQAMPTAINPVIWFELSLTNADKPSLQPEAAVERVLQFFELAPQLQSCQWGVLLTNAPLFAQKVDLLQPMTASTQLTFCIGTDTLVRLLDPKYYQNSRDTMIATLEQLPCHFVAGGRVNSQNVFVTGEAALAELPRHVAAKFTLLPEFRVDISSTELREQTKKSN